MNVGTRRARTAGRRLLFVLGVGAAAAAALQLSGAAASGAPVSTSAVAAMSRAGATSPPPQPAQPPGERGVPPVQTPSPGTTTLERGRQLFQSGCAGCHGQNGGGSPRGPSLIGVGAASADFQLSTGRMPLNKVVDQPLHSEPAYDPTDIRALVTYVASLGTGPPIPQLGAGDLQSGRELYIANCAACHSSAGVGEALPGGERAPSVLQTDPLQIAEAVRVGPGLMPQFPAGALSDTEVASIATYVQTIPTNIDKGGWPIAAIGPVTEGAIGWLVGLGLLVVVIRLLGQRAKS